MHLLFGNFLVDFAPIDRRRVMGPRLMLRTNLKERCLVLDILSVGFHTQNEDFKHLIGHIGGQVKHRAGLAE